MKTKIITNRTAIFAVFALMFNLLSVSFVEAGCQPEKRHGFFANLKAEVQQKKADRQRQREQIPAPCMNKEAAKQPVASSSAHSVCHDRVVERTRIVYKDVVTVVERPVIREVEVDVPVYKPVPRVIEVNMPVYKPVPREILVDIPVYKPVPRVIEVDIPVYKQVVQEICVNIPVYKPQVVEIPVQMPVYQPQVVQRRPCVQRQQVVYQPPPQQTYRRPCYQQQYRGPSGPPPRHYDRGGYASRGHSGPSVNQGVVFGNNQQFGSGGNNFNLGNFGGNRPNPNAGLAHAAINQALGSMGMIGHRH